MEDSMPVAGTAAKEKKVHIAEISFGRATHSLGGVNSELAQSLPEVKPKQQEGALRKFSLPTRKVLADLPHEAVVPKVMSSPKAKPLPHPQKSKRDSTVPNTEDAVTRHIRRLHEEVLRATGGEIGNPNEYDESYEENIPAPPIALNARDREVYEREERRRLHREQRIVAKNAQQQKDREEFMSRIHEITEKKKSLPQSRFVQMHEDRMRTLAKKKEEEEEFKRKDEEIRQTLRKQKGASAALAISQAKAAAAQRTPTKAAIQRPNAEAEAEARRVMNTCKVSDEEVMRRRHEIDARAEQRRQRQKDKEAEAAMLAATKESEEKQQKDRNREQKRNAMRLEALERIAANKEKQQQEESRTAAEEAEFQHQEALRKKAVAARHAELRKERELRETQTKMERENILLKVQRENHVLRIVKEENERYDKEIRDAALEKKRSEWRSNVEDMKQKLAEREEAQTIEETRQLERRMAFDVKCKMQRMMMLGSEHYDEQTSHVGGSSSGRSPRSETLFDRRPFLHGARHATAPN